MLLYFDVSCLNRPFDDQRQSRIRLESEAVTLILDRIDAGAWRQISSEIAEIEIDAIADNERHKRVMALLPTDRIPLTAGVFARAAVLERLGFKAADAAHLASAEAATADVFLTCDDRLARVAVRQQAHLKVRVANPLDWIKEMTDGSNA